MTADSDKPFDRELLFQRRRRHAGTAQSYDFLLQRVADDFVERLQIVKRDFPCAINVGSHHGVVSRAIGSLANVGAVIDCDRTAELLAQCDGLRVLSDEQALPFGNSNIDLAVSALSLQFVNDLPGALVQIRRSLKSDGLFLGALLGGDTLRELRQAWYIAEEEVTGGASPRVAPFIDVRSLGALAQRAGFALPVADSDLVTVTYETPLNLMQELRAMGASNVLNSRRRVPVIRKLLLRACEVYAERFGLADGRVPATFELLTLTCWVPDESQPQPLRPGSAEISLADVLGKKSQS
ncbi:MAG: methyltransferase domain-containing protein [Filomicrobium sp.]